MLIRALFFNLRFPKVVFSMYLNDQDIDIDGKIFSVIFSL